MSGHTPGPWLVGGRSATSACGCRKSYEIFDLGDFAVLPAPGQAGPVAIAAGRANALLIAAAPELLEALRSVDAMFSEPRKHNSHTIAANVRAAIAKATSPGSSKP